MAECSLADEGSVRSVVNKGIAVSYLDPAELRFVVVFFYHVCGGIILQFRLELILLIFSGFLFQKKKKKEKGLFHIKGPSTSLLYHLIRITPRIGKRKPQ